ncbi:MAG: prolyl oligopeptidase family serine peptidase, partial [Myxococcota bacterium]|nr:prolyl oligopeptidase family serine peptidase [Myxococcota bacterium]
YTPSARANDTKLTLQPSQSGFITAWAVSPRQSKKRAAELALGPPPSHATLQAGPGPFVSLGKRPSRTRTSVAWIELNVQQASSATLRFGGDGYITAYLNGQMVGQQPYHRSALIDDAIVPLRLSPGTHQLALVMSPHKGSRSRAWRLAARILDSTGRPPVSLTYRLKRPNLETAVSVNAKMSTISWAPAIREGSVIVDVATQYEGLFIPETPIQWRISHGRASVATGRIGETARLVLPPSGRHTLVTLTMASRRETRRFGTYSSWLQKLQRIDNALERLPDELPTVTKDTLNSERKRLAQHVLHAIQDGRWLNRELDRLVTLSETAAEGHDPLLKERGAFRRAYRSRFDGQLQQYSIHVPKRYTGSRKWPLVVGLHGLGSSPHMTLRQVLGMDRDKDAGEPGEPRAIRSDMPRLPDRGVITVCPYAYGDTAFWFYGELDVLRVIDEVQRDYAIDTDRIILTGLSLGGLGTYHIGHHFPDRFASLGPLGGFSSVKLYRQIRRHKKAPWEYFLIDQRDATTYAENGKYTPMYVVHGERDAPRHARAMTSRYEALGYQYTLDIPEGFGHDVWQYSYGRGRLLRSLLRHRRKTKPREIVFKTLSYRYRTAYWAHIDRFISSNAKTQLGAHVDLKQRIFHLSRLDNIRGITLDPGKSPISTAGDVTIALPNGQSLRSNTRSLIHLQKEDDRWSLVSSVVEPTGFKRPGVSGPLDDIMFEPHRFVIGTQDPVQTDINRRLVAEDRRYLRHRNHHIRFPVSDDVEVTDAQLKNEHLVLYGNTRSNIVLKRLVDAGLPLTFDTTGITLQHRRFEGKDVGIKMIYPNPLSPDHYVVVVAGVTWEGTLLSRHLPRFLPDVVVYDQRIKSRYLERIMVDRSVRFGAFFDERWQLPRTR